jgi:hypothetical protein
MIVALGRIYDDDRDTHSGCELLKYVETYPGLFTRPALRDRRMRGGATQADADKFVEGAHELSLADLRPLRSAFDEQLAIYVGKVKPIRDKAYAHSARITRDALEAMFYDLPAHTIERLVVLPMQLQRSLWHAYFNGSPPVLDDAAPTIVGDVLANPVPPRANTWEHRHAASDTAQFLDELLVTARNRAAE